MVAGMAILSGIVMLRATFKERHGKPIYFGAACLCFYFAVTYILIAVLSLPSPFATTWVRPALILLLALPTIFYIMRGK